MGHYITIIDGQNENTPFLAFDMRFQNGETSYDVAHAGLGKVVAVEFTETRFPCEDGPDFLLLEIDFIDEDGSEVALDQHFFTSFSRSYLKWREQKPAAKVTAAKRRKHGA